MNDIERIYNLLESFLGQSKQGCYDSYTTQYQWDCPFCAEEKGYSDGKLNLEVSLAIFKFHCWSCDSSGTLAKLIKQKGNADILKEYYSIVESLKKSQLYDINLFNEHYDEDVFKEPLKLPKNYRKIIINECKNYNLLNYLKKRNITQDIIDKFHIGYTIWDENEKSWSNRLIIPSYDSKGFLNYFVGRDFLPEKKEKQLGGFFRPKYKNCDANKKDIVFQEGLIDWDSDIYLCEGAIDCIYANNAISLLGKILTKDSMLFQTLYNKANANIVICLDADTNINETKKIYNLLNFGRLRNKIQYIRLNKYKDFGEIYENFGKKGIITAFKNAQQFKEIDLIFE